MAEANPSSYALTMADSIEHRQRQIDSAVSLLRAFFGGAEVAQIWRLLAFAEAEAVRRGYCEIHLYTHRTMTENQRLYAAIGYEETGRGTEAGYERVFMRKRLAG